jgi:hypothetical protein
MNIIDRRKNILRHSSKKTPKRSLSDIKGIIVHHSLTTSGSADAFANFHVKTNGWSCMGYHYVINRDGNKDGLIEWCADWTDVTPHVGKYNKHYIGICLVGDFRKQKPTQKQMKALYELLEYLMNKLNISVENVLGHQELPSYSWKQCPALNMGELRGHLKYKTYGEVQNNYNNDLKIEIIKPKIKKQISAPKPLPKLNQEKLQEVMKMKMSDFVNDYNMQQLATVYREAREQGLLKDDRWEKKAANHEITVGEVAFLATILDHRRFRDFCKK